MTLEIFEKKKIKDNNKIFNPKLLNIILFQFDGYLHLYLRIFPNDGCILIGIRKNGHHNITIPVTIIKKILLLRLRNKNSIFNFLNVITIIT